MSCGIGHMCITMGIAEAIAITTIVTASIFAISPRLWPGLIRLSNRRSFDCGDSVIRLFCQQPSSSPSSFSGPLLLLCLKGEIGSSSRARGHRHFLRLGTGGFLPRRHSVASGRHVVDGVGTVRISGCVWPFDYSEPTVHPGM